MSNNVLTAKISSALACPSCGSVASSGKMTCSGCGAPLGGDLTLQALNDLGQLNHPGTTPIGQVSFTDWQEVTLAMSGQEMVLPLAERVLLGRADRSTHGDLHCDVDLTPFGAREKGVSRQHLLIRRQNALLYATDLGSTNGTY